MFGSNTRKANSEMENLVKEARDLLNKASGAAGDNADDLRQKGMNLLDSGLARASALQADAIKSSKEFADSADSFVQENPWRSVAIGAALAAGVGVIVGLSASRK